jgi:hypothetical protein
MTQDADNKPDIKPLPRAVNDALYAVCLEIIKLKERDEAKTPAKRA